MSRRKVVTISNMTFETQEPSQCPHCGLHMEVLTTERNAVNFGNTNMEMVLTVVYKCASVGCSRAFFSVYRATAQGNSPVNFSTETILSYPEYCADNIVSDIKDIAPTAMKIYGQAMAAKARGMDELVGMGIRKAIDSLLYEVGKVFYPEESEFNESPKTTLKQRIDKYVESKRLKDLVEACVWLGNDFTHPIQRHRFKDTELLEKLMLALLYHVEMLFVASGAKDALESDADS